MSRLVLGTALALVAATSSACNSFKGTTCRCTTTSGTTEEIVTDGSCAAIQEGNPAFTSCTVTSQGSIGTLGPTLEAMTGPPDLTGEWGVGTGGQ